MFRSLATRCLAQSRCAGGSITVPRPLSSRTPKVFNKPRQFFGQTSITAASCKPVANISTICQRWSSSLSDIPEVKPTDLLFAIVHVGGKQYKVAPNDIIITNKLEAEVGSKIRMNKVLLVGCNDFTLVGQPLLSKDNAQVVATVIEQSKTGKVQVFKKKRRKGYARRQGHRQDVSKLLINSVELLADS